MFSNMMRSETRLFFKRRHDMMKVQSWEFTLKSCGFGIVLTEDVRGNLRFIPPNVGGILWMWLSNALQQQLL